MSKELGRVLRQARVSKKLKLREVGIAISEPGGPVVTPQAVGNWERGVNEPKAAHMQRLAKVLSLDFNELLSLRSDTPDLPPARRSLVQSFDPDAPEDADDDTRPPFPADGISELVNKAGLGSGQIIETTYSRETPAGDHMQVDAIRDDYWRLPGYFIREGFQTRVADLLVIQGEGDSMAPTVANNDRVFVNTAHRVPTPDGLYAIRDQFDAVIVKRLEMAGPDRVNVISDNPKHTPRERDLSEIEIVGRVVGVLKLT